MKLIETEYTGKILRKLSNSVSTSENAEEQVKNLYEYFNYNVVNLHPYINLEEEIKDKFIEKHQISNELVKKGVPDLIIYNKEELFFVEVKRKKHGLSFAQLTWNAEHNFETRVVWVFEEDYDISNEVEARKLGTKRFKKSELKNRVLNHLKEFRKSKKTLITDIKGLTSKHEGKLNDVLIDLINEGKIKAVKKQDKLYYEPLIGSRYSENTEKLKYDKTRLLDEINSLNEEFEQLNLNTWSKEKNYGTDLIYTYFGSWERAKILAGIKEPSIPDELNKD